MLLPLILAQIASAVSPERIDFTTAQPCQAKKTEEVVVCAKRGDSPYRLRDVPPAKRQAMPDAQVTIAEGVTAGAEIESADVGGFQSNRMIVRFKLKF